MAQGDARASRGRDQPAAVPDDRRSGDGILGDDALSIPRGEGKWLKQLFRGQKISGCEEKGFPFIHAPLP